MNPIEPSLLASLDFTAAAAIEASAWRNLLPSEPWQNAVKNAPAQFGAVARLRMEAGMPSAPSVVVRARKAHQQSRPVPVVGIAERIAYRALATQVLADVPPAARSSSDYGQFVSGPIMAGIPKGISFRVSDAIVSHVVESDIAAFYEYVDHAVLLDELQLRTATLAAPAHLVELLTEMQGKPFGLPQLLDPSDELSEVYIRIVERELVRRGARVWRYNDDFHVVASDYAQAQADVELLAREASKVGLVLNERKTRIWTFSSYFWRHWTQTPTEGDIEFKPELVNVSNDYGELEDEELTELAHTTITRLGSTADSDNLLDLSDLKAEASRDLGRALAILTKHADPFGQDAVPRVMKYAGHFTHRLGAYLGALHGAGKPIGHTWDQLVAAADDFNAWQRIWLVHLARTADLLSDAGRRVWVADQVGRDDVLDAECALALAPHGSISFDEVDQWLRTKPEALLPWYALAAGKIPDIAKDRVNAIRSSNALVQLLVEPPT